MTDADEQATSWHRDPADIEAGLVAWARDALGGATVEQVTGTTAGRQNDTVLFRLNGDRVAARLAPPPETPLRTFPTYDLERQARVMRLVAERSSARVPAIVHLESSSAWLGVPFLVMEALDGSPAADVPPYLADPTGWFRQGTAEQWARFQETTIELVARVHEADDDGSDAFAILRPDGSGMTALARQMEHQRGYYEWALDGATVPIIERAFELLTKTMPPTDAAALTWGDARPANILYQDFRAAVALDWEMATVGPPEVDLAWVTFFHRFGAAMVERWGLGDVPPLFDPRQSKAVYERVAGHEIDDLTWYEAYSGLRLAIIMSRIARQSAALANTALPDDPDDMFMFRPLLEQLLSAL